MTSAAGWIGKRSSRRALRSLASALLIAPLLSCTPESARESGAEALAESATMASRGARTPNPSPFLYVWAGAEQEEDSDFLAVIDAAPASDRYGEIVASVPVGLKGGAHHTEHVMPRGDTLFVNSFAAGTSFLIDLSTPFEPVVVGSFREIGEYTYPHTFERLPSGNVLVTFQTKGEGNKVAGGLVELNPAGRLVRSAAAADPVDPELRAYSVTPIPAIDRAVSTTSDMNVEAQGTSFQLWRLSDLQLLRTVRLPEGPLGYEHRDPAEVRLLPDSMTAIMTTFTCAMYLLHDLETDEPWAELIHVMPWETYDTDECGIPLTRGRFWVQTYANSGRSSLVSLDISDPSSPVVIDELTLGEPWWPHWISMEPAGDRIVVTSGDGATLYRVLIVRLDLESGRLTLDSTFRDPGADVPGVRFDRSGWPHGAAGAARPHGAVFSRAANTRHEDPTQLCQPFQSELEAVPHLELSTSTGDYESIWDGTTEPGCEVRFVTSDSIRAGVDVPDFDAIKGSEMHRLGWRESPGVRADGPGSGLYGLETDSVTCVVRWEQPSYIDDGGDIVQSETLSITIQCRESPP